MKVITWLLKIDININFLRYDDSGSETQFDVQFLGDASQLIEDGKAIEAGNYRTSILQDYGPRLFNYLFPAAFQKLFIDDFLQIESVGGRLRLLLQFDYQQAQALANLHWELMSFVPSFGRYANFATLKQLILLRFFEPALNLAMSKPHIQLLIASPEYGGETGFKPINAELVLNTLSELSQAGLIKLEVPQQRVDLKKFEEGSRRGANILHLIAHAEANPPRIILVNSSAWPEAQEALVLLDKLPKELPQLLVLQSCEGANASTSLGDIASLFAGSFPLVIAMRYSVPAYIANSFCAAFYRSLAKDGDIESALQIGRNELLQFGGYQALHFANPILFSHQLRPKAPVAQLPFSLEDALSAAPEILSLNMRGNVREIGANSYQFEARVRFWQASLQEKNSRLLQILERQSLDELKRLCFLLDYPYRKWLAPATHSKSLSIEIIQYATRQHGLSSLLLAVAREDTMAQEFLGGIAEEMLSVFISKDKQLKQSRYEFQYQDYSIQFFEL